MNKSTQAVLELIDSGVPIRSALTQCGFNEVSEATMEKLKARAGIARNFALQGLYEAANDSSNSPSARAKAFETWDRMSKQSEAGSMHIVINIEGEKDE